MMGIKIDRAAKVLVAMAILGIVALILVWTMSAEVRGTIASEDEHEARDQTQAAAGPAQGLDDAFAPLEVSAVAKTMIASDHESEFDVVEEDVGSVADQIDFESDLSLRPNSSVAPLAIDAQPSIPAEAAAQESGADDRQGSTSVSTGPSAGPENIDPFFEDRTDEDALDPGSSEQLIGDFIDLLLENADQLKAMNATRLELGIVRQALALDGSRDDIRERRNRLLAQERAMRAESADSLSAIEEGGIQRIQNTWVHQREQLRGLREQFFIQLHLMEPAIQRTLLGLMNALDGRDEHIRRALGYSTVAKRVKGQSFWQLDEITVLSGLAARESQRVPSPEALALIEDQSILGIEVIAGRGLVEILAPKILDGGELDSYAAMGSAAQAVAALVFAPEMSPFRQPYLDPPIRIVCFGSSSGLLQYIAPPSGGESDPAAQPAMRFVAPLAGLAGATGIALNVPPTQATDRFFNRDRLIILGVASGMLDRIDASRSVAWLRAAVPPYVSMVMTGSGAYRFWPDDRGKGFGRWSLRIGRSHLVELSPLERLIATRSAADLDPRHFARLVDFLALAEMQRPGRIATALRQSRSDPEATPARVFTLAFGRTPEEWDGWHLWLSMLPGR